MELQLTIGIEIHAELKIKTKMFSNAPVTFAAIPNSSVNEIDLGYPGTLPSVNKHAVLLAIRVCNALKMKIDSRLIFDRKNYFYPDLPKGYQITQQNFPIGKNGVLEINVNDQIQEILIERLHLEEDTAKQIHKEDITLLDYNRSGNALIEIVSAPVIHDIEAAINYIETLRKILLHLEVSDAKMNEGSFRCDINVSLKDARVKPLGHRVEIKNLNSLSNVKKSLEFEIERQTKLIKAEQPLKDNETRRFDEKKQETVLMRTKASIIDYKTFPEPNIMPIDLDPEWIQDVIQNSPEGYQQKQKRYEEDYGLNKTEVNILLSDLALTNFFENTIKHTKHYRTVLNYLIIDINGYLKQNKIGLEETKLTSINLAKMIDILEEKVISQRQAKTLLLHLLEYDEDVNASIKNLDLQQINDVDVITNLIRPFILENSDIIKQYNTRPERVLKFYMGHLMKITKGQVNPEVSQSIIKKIIEELL